jgi:polysaccharide pyruvyl transferase WcaK-like protein
MSERTKLTKGFTIRSNHLRCEDAHMNILLANDTDGRENIGCRLTSQLLKKSIINAFGPETHIISAPWRFRKKFNAKLIAHLAFSRKNLSENFWKDLACFQYGASILGSLKLVDCVVFQPEGSINDGDSVERILGLLSLPIYAHVAMNKPVITINGTFPLFNDFRYEIIKAFNEMCVHSSMRDRLSAEKYGVNFIPDAACTYTHSNGKDRDSILITTGAEFDRETDVLFGKRILQHCEVVGLRPIVLTKKWEHFQSLRDSVWRLGGEFHEFSELADAARIINRCRYHIGGRYHMAIFCACLDVPSFLIRTNTHKNIWLTQDINGIINLSSIQFSDEEISTNISEMSVGKVQKSMQDMSKLHSCEIAKLAQEFQVEKLEMYSGKMLSRELLSRIRSFIASGVMQRIFFMEKFLPAIKGYDPVKELNVRKEHANV